MTYLEKGTDLWKAILKAGLWVGTFDILAAVIQTLINGRDPLVMLKFIASGVFGKQALNSDFSYSLAGLFFHYGIALVWTLIFFMVYPKITFFRKNKIAAGVLYGCVVWAAMSQIVLPLSNTPPIPFRLQNAVTAALILIVAIGIPLSFMANRYFQDRES